MVTTLIFGLAPDELMVFSKMPKITEVPPPAPHGTMSLAVLQAKLGAATALDTGAKATAPRTTAVPHNVVTIPFVIFHSW